MMTVPKNSSNSTLIKWVGVWALLSTALCGFVVFLDLTFKVIDHLGGGMTLTSLSDSIKFIVSSPTLACVGILVLVGCVTLCCRYLATRYAWLQPIQLLSIGLTLLVSLVFWVLAIILINFVPSKSIIVYK